MSKTHNICTNVPSSQTFSSYVNLPAVLHSCKIGSLQLKEEHELKAFENNVLRRIFGSKWEVERRRVRYKKKR
jgi:hypothetical protein